MIDFFGTVEGEDTQVEAPQMSADDAQAAEEVSAEALLANLTGESGTQETAVNTGDGDPAAQSTQERESNQHQAENDKFSRRISAALRSQKEQIYRELGMSEADVRELIRAHKAEQMHKEDPEISVKAAGEILKAREATAAAKPPEDSRSEQMRSDIRTLVADGWTSEMLQAFTTDADTIAKIEEGMTVRQAATAYLLRGQTASKQAARKGVPTIRTATASAAPDEDRIASMSDADFDRLAKRAREAAYAGKRVVFR